MKSAHSAAKARGPGPEPKPGSRRLKWQTILRMALLVALAGGAFLVVYGLTRLGSGGAPAGGPPGMVWIPGGEFTMGSNEPYASRAEGPAHRVRLDGFWIDETDVTNAQFRAFVEATGYVTTAERTPTLEEIMSQAPPDAKPPKKEDLVPGSVVFTPPDHPVSL